MTSAAGSIAASRARFGAVEGIKLVYVDRAAREKSCVQPLGGALLAVAGIHGALGQQPLVGVVDQRQFAEFFAVSAGGVGVLGQHFRRYTGAFQFVDGLCRFLAESRTAALAVVVDDLVQQRIRRAAQQQGAARLGQGGHRRPTVTAQQGLRQRGEGVTFHISGKAVPQGAVELPFGGGGELFRYDEDAALPAFRTGAQFSQHLIGFARTGGAEDEV